MSLTSQINDPNSPYRAFIAQFLPDLGHAWRWQGNSLNGMRVTPPTSVTKSGNWRPGNPVIMPGQVNAFPWATVGTALDYRLRFRFVTPPATALIAFLGAQAISDFLHTEHKHAQEMIETIVGEVHAIGGGSHVRPQDDQKEVELARLCYALALFDPAFRRSDSLTADWPVVQAAANGDLGTILDSCSTVAAKDLAALSSETFRQFPFNASPCKGVVNPTFAGSRSVGGADADLVINGLLVDFKTTSKPGAAGADLMQVLGYLMLDWDDQTGIEQVGIFYPRQRVLVSWNADDLVGMASTGKYTVSTLRSNFKREFEKYLPATSGPTFTVHWGFELSD